MVLQLHSTYRPKMCIYRNSFYGVRLIVLSVARSSRRSRGIVVWRARSCWTRPTRTTRKLRTQSDPSTAVHCCCVILGYSPLWLITIPSWHSVTRSPITFIATTHSASNWRYALVDALYLRCFLWKLIFPFVPMFLKLIFQNKFHLWNHHFYTPVRINFKNFLETVTWPCSSVSQTAEPATF